jgi:hypothetical protein
VRTSDSDAGPAGSKVGNLAVIVSAMLPAARPEVSGSARPGAVLTATAGTFSGVPDAVTGVWFVGGVATGNTSASLPVTAAMVGKVVTYVSTATKGGASAVTSTSAPITVQAAPKPPVPVKVASVTKVGAISVAKKGAKVTIKVAVSASKARTGTLTVVIAKGSKRVVAKTVAVSASGAATISVAKFNKMALKAIKGKSKTRYRGKYTLSVTYNGNAQVKPSAAKSAFKVK